MKWSSVSGAKVTLAVLVLGLGLPIPAVAVTVALPPVNECIALSKRPFALSVPVRVTSVPRLVVNERAWSNVRSVEVGSFAYLFVYNYTGGSLRLEIVGVETRSFGEDFVGYWRSVPLGNYTIRARAWCGSASDQRNFNSVGEYALEYRCVSAMLAMSSDSLEGEAAAPVVIRAADLRP